MKKLVGMVRVAAAVTLLPVMLVQQSFAWGADGHKMINRLAAAALPADVPAFLRNGAALDTMDYLGPEPDRWKNHAEEDLSVTQSPDHFIDMEWAELVMVPCAADGAAGCPANGKDLPHKRYDYIRAVEKAAAAHPDLNLTAEKIGFQPWQVEEVYERLKAGLREYRKLVAAVARHYSVQRLDWTKPERVYDGSQDSFAVRDDVRDGSGEGCRCGSAGGGFEAEGFERRVGGLPGVSAALELASREDVSA